MNIQRKNSAHHFRMQSEREQTFLAVKTRSVPMAAKVSAMNASMSYLWCNLVNYLPVVYREYLDETELVNTSLCTAATI